EHQPCERLLCAADAWYGAVRSRTAPSRTSALPVRMCSADMKKVVVRESPLRSDPALCASNACTDWMACATVERHPTPLAPTRTGSVLGSMEERKSPMPEGRRTVDGKRPRFLSRR